MEGFGIGRVDEEGPDDESPAVGLQSQLKVDAEIGCPVGCFGISVLADRTGFLVGHEWVMNGV